MSVFRNEQRSILKGLISEILSKYKEQTLIYNKEENSIQVNSDKIILPKTSPRATIATRTTHTR